jgi:uncharacterized lipoprotein YddW (UPF0748 family)
MKVFRIFTLLLFLTTIIHSQSNLPKREFRGAWISTVSRIDWPSNSIPSQQKADFIKILDYLKDAGINAVIFQIRPECDALYDSPIDPWSYWLTGTQGSPPNPYYDPLVFAIEEAHKRGMELHAWFNPYRVKTSGSSYPFDPTHVINQHPEWVLYVGDDTVLDPGLPEVRERIINVISDVVTRYDVDGVHMDDYFYPWAGITNQDAGTFANYPRGFTNIADWRRDNVNILIQGIHDAIGEIKSHVKFGMSPFGIWKNGVPPGIIGTSGWGHPLYSDAVAWLQAGSIDYFTPQLYWAIGGPQDYSLLMPWWAGQLNGRHFYPGQAMYRIINNNWPASEIINQILLNRAEEECLGSVFFTANTFAQNPKGIVDSLKNNYYRYKSILPSMNWKDIVEPNEPFNVNYERLPGQAIAGLTWDLPNTAADGDSASRYVVYRFEDSNIQPEDFDDPANIFDVVGDRTAKLKSGNSPTSQYNIAVTSLDRNYNESIPSNTIIITEPEIPLLAFPENGAGDQRDTVQLGWIYPAQSAAYNLEVASDQNFTDVVFEKNGLTDTLENVTGIAGQQTFYWKVQSTNPAGQSDYSEIRSFTTAFPAEPFLIYPPDVTPEIPVNIDLVWSSIPSAESYHVQLARGADFAQSSIVVDSAGVIDTSLTAPTLDANRFHFLRVRAINSFGSGLWSEVHRFKTQNVTLVADETSIPTDFDLFQNYPNPFNPTTTIEFSVAESGLTTLKVFDILGREVAELISEELNPGKYSVNFDAGRLSSGIYIYSLSSKNKIFNKKMSFIK